MQHQVNLSPITQFIQTVRIAELGQQKEIRLPIQNVRLLTLALSELLDKINQDYESMYNILKGSVETAVVEVQMDGGGFEDK